MMPKKDTEVSPSAALTLAVKRLNFPMRSGNLSYEMKQNKTK